VQLDDDAVLAATQRIFDHGYGVTALSVAYELNAVDDTGRPDAPAVEARLLALADAGTSSASRYRTNGSASRKAGWRSTTTTSRALEALAFGSVAPCSAWEGRSIRASGVTSPSR
jgi:hypothetical protein